MTLPTALNKATDALRLENTRIAYAGSLLVEKFQRSSDPESLEQLKTFVRSGIQYTNDMISTYRDRVRRRTPHFNARIGRKPELGKQLSAHRTVLDRRLDYWRERESILRQIGDAAIWHMLRYDIRQIVPLYKPSTHQLPTGHGLAGVIQLQQNLHRSGHFLAMEADLTRCVGVGDLIVVRRDGSQLAPLAVEVKTKAPERLVEGAELEVLMLTYGSGHPWDQEALRLFSEVSGKELEDEMVVSKRAERQAEEIAERTRLIADALTAGAGVLQPPVRNWKALKRVALRARVSGFSVDLAERGVYYFAVRTDQDAADRLRAVRDEVRRHTDVELGYATSADLLKREDLSGIVPPVALWNLPTPVRACILSGELLVGTFHENRVIEELFLANGMELHVDDNEWIVRKPGMEPIRVAPIHAMAVQLGLVLGALSAESFVTGILDAFSRKSEDTVDA